MHQVDKDEFREFLGNLASGVTVVTAVDSSGRVAGMTASAVCALSLDPPLLIVCVNLRDPLHDVISHAKSFAVNMLAHDQEALSQQFAGKPEARFDDVICTTDTDGVPLLAGTVASVVCEPKEVHPGGDHTIFVGLVVRGSAAGGRPLLHFQGRYTTVSAD
jgi:flavin reductase (DIM6/NTAB) family NADH-FMN oxidoreductase RutF